MEMHRGSLVKMIENGGPERWARVSWRKYPLPRRAVPQNWASHRSACRQPNALLPFGIVAFAMSTSGSAAPHCHTKFLVPKEYIVSRLSYGDRLPCGHPTNRTWSRPPRPHHGRSSGPRTPRTAGGVSSQAAAAGTACERRVWPRRRRSTCQLSVDIKASTPCSPRRSRVRTAFFSKTRLEISRTLLRRSVDATASLSCHHPSSRSRPAKGWSAYLNVTVHPLKMVLQGR